MRELVVQAPNGSVWKMFIDRDGADFAGIDDDFLVEHIQVGDIKKMEPMPPGTKATVFLRKPEREDK